MLVEPREVPVFYTERPAREKEPLSELASQINTAHAAAKTAAKSTIEHAIKCGALLNSAKTQVPHGQWLPWLQNHCSDVSERMAQNYMRLHDRRAELKSETGFVFEGTIKSALVAIAKHRESAPVPPNLATVEVPARPPEMTLPPVQCIEQVGGKATARHVAAPPAPEVLDLQAKVVSVDREQAKRRQTQIQEHLDALFAEGKKNAATFSPGTILRHVVLLERKLVEDGIIMSNKRYEKWKAKAMVADDPDFGSASPVTPIVRTEILPPRGPQHRNSQVPFVIDNGPEVLEGEILQGPLVWRETEDGLKARGVRRTYLIRSFEGKFQLVDDDERSIPGRWLEDISIPKRSAERIEFDDRAELALAKKSRG